MRSKIGSLILGTLSAAYLLVGVGHAHRQPEMVSQVEFVTLADGALVTQVTHRIHAHDAMKLIGQYKDVGSPNLDDPKLLDRLGRTLMESLDLSLEGTLIGAEVDRNYLYVYEEVQGHADLIGAHGLSAIAPEWTHRVDLKEPNTAVQSYTFSEQRGETLKELVSTP